MIDFFIYSINNATSINLSAGGIVNSLVRNTNLSEDHRFSFLETNLQMQDPMLGVRSSALMGSNSRTEGLSFDPSSLSSRVWSELGKELMTGFSDEKLYYMQALMELDASPDSVKEEIANHLLSDEYIRGATQQPEYKTTQQQIVYISIYNIYISNDKI